jgi:hypothetical protein
MSREDERAAENQKGNTVDDWRQWMLLINLPVWNGNDVRKRRNAWKQ